jgi:hypothetical protein
LVALKRFEVKKKIFSLLSADAFSLILDGNLKLIEVKLILLFDLLQY